MARAIVTLTTDFGDATPYVAEMKGVLLSLVRDLHIVDICHRIRPQDVVQASRVVARIVTLFPARSIHLVVVDPGVGTERRIVAADVDQRLVVAPDNGLLSGLWTAARQRRAVVLDRHQFWRSRVSSTFHGRDIMAPVAAYLARGVPLEHLGSPCWDITLLKGTEPVVTKEKVRGQVVEVDGFGNLITNIARHHLPRWDLDSLQVRCGGERCLPIVDTYGQVEEGRRIALWGSSRCLEVAISGGNAARQLGVAEGAEVTVHCRRRVES